MKNFCSKIVTAMMILGTFFCNSPAMAINTVTTAGVETSILKKCGNEAEGAEGEGVKCILNLAVDILSVVVGIVGVLGIVIVGIQYLTAGDNEEKTRKAKRRIFEIVIGVVAYVLIYAFLKFLLPNFNPPAESGSTSCITTTIASVDS